MAKYYTGIGSRQTPEPIIDLMMTIGEQLGYAGWTLRSGGAPGADMAFEAGGRKYDREIFIPWNGFQNRDISDPVVFDPLAARDSFVKEACRIAAAHHPAWDKCSRAAKMLHTRNVFQALGRDLKHPSKFLICWTYQARLQGGTATAMRIAASHQIPVFNLANTEDRGRIDRWIERLGQQKAA